MDKEKEREKEKGRERKGEIDRERENEREGNSCISKVLTSIENALKRKKKITLQPNLENR